MVTVKGVSLIGEQTKNSVCGTGPLTLCRSNSPIGILNIELHAVLDGKVCTLYNEGASYDPENTVLSVLRYHPSKLMVIFTHSPLLYAVTTLKQ